MDCVLCYRIRIKQILILFVPDLQAKYIASCLDEIKQELRQQDAAVKANAVSKLTYVRWECIRVIHCTVDAQMPLQGGKLQPGESPGQTFYFSCQ